MTTEPKNSATKNLFIDNRWLIISAIFAFILYLLLPVLTPFLVAGILAYICDPLVDRLCLVGTQKTKIGRTLATVLVMAGLLGIVVLLFIIIVPLLQKESLLIAARLPSAIQNIRLLVEPWLQQHFGINFAIDSTQIQSIISKNWRTAGGLLGDALRLAGSNSLALINMLANVLLLPVVLFYLLRDWDKFMASIAELIPREWQSKTCSVAREVDQVLSEFLRGQVTVMVIMSIFYVLGLWFVGLDMALAIGILAGMLGFVPYLGAALGLGLAVLVAVLQFTSLGQVLPVLMVFGLGQLLESMVVTPKLVGDRIGLHPVVVIFALLAGGQLFGFSGVLLALPVSAAIAVGLRHTKDNYLNSDTYLN